MTMSGRWRSKSSHSCSTESASTLSALSRGLPIESTRAWHLARLREAMTTSPNTSGFWAHLWATTVPTPPAPMMMTFDISVQGVLIWLSAGRFDVAAITMKVIMPKRMLNTVDTAMTVLANVAPCICGTA